MLCVDRFMKPTPAGFSFPIAHLSADPPAAFGRNPSVTTCGGAWGDTYITWRGQRHGMGGELFVGYECLFYLKRGSNDPLVRII